MANKIQRLPDSIANQIAAGEVVDRPASAVKELMENAVDAGSSSIKVNFRDGGKELIQVMDNGCGMSVEDAKLAFERHATSKIRDVHDIYALSTFGFRGEALASIGAISEVEMTTRQADDQLGTKIDVCGGKFTAETPVNSPVGTRIVIKNLFYNVPARRRFLDKSTTEGRYITTEFQRVALCHPDIEFALFANDAPTYNLPASSLKQRIVGIMGKQIAGNLLEVSAETSIVKIEGFVGKPEASRQRSSPGFLFVNGRYFESKQFRKAILQAYEKLIPSNTQPPFFIYLTIDPEKIDVNVHPKKIEIKFEDNGAVWQIINAAVKESLGKLGIVPLMDFDVDSSIDIPVYRNSGYGYREPQIRTNPEFNPFNDQQHIDLPRRERAEYTEFISREFQDQEQEFDRSLMEFIDGNETPTQSRMELAQDEVFGGLLPINGRFCAARIGTGLAIVDLKRAKEVILYERYMLMLGNGSSVTQQLLFPERVHLSPTDMEIIRDSTDEFEEFGFDLSSEDSVDSVTVTGIPADFTGESAAGIIEMILDMMREEHSPIGELRTTRFATILARVGSHKTVDSSAIETLLSELSSCNNPNYTADGRMVVKLITEGEIFSYFR